MSTDQQLLRQALAETADEVVAVDVLERVLLDVDRQRRRRRMWIGGGVLAAAAAAVVGVLVLAPEDRTAEPADLPAPPIRVLLDTEAADQVERPTLAVLSDADITWVLDDTGRQHALRTDTLVPGASGIGLTSDGRWLLTAGPVPGGWLASVVDVAGVQQGLAETAIVAPQMGPEGTSGVPEISPDGALVAIGTRGFGVHVQLLRTDGSQSALVGLDDWDYPVVQQLGEAGVDVAFSADGSQLVVFTGADVGIIDVEAALAEVAHGPTAVALDEPATAGSGWAASPDLSQIAVSSPGPTWATEERRWSIVDTETGETVREFSRPLDERLIAWRGDDTLVWVRRSWSTGAFEIVIDDVVTMAISPPAGQVLSHAAHVS